MKAPLPRSLSLAPVLARLADESCSRALDPDPTRRCHTVGCVRAVAEHVGISRRTLHRYASKGVTIDQAERIADALGTHPADLWGVAAWNVALDESDAALARFWRVHPHSKLAKALIA